MPALFRVNSMCLDMGMGFMSILVWDLPSEDSKKPFIGQNIFVLKVPFMGSGYSKLVSQDT